MANLTELYLNKSEVEGQCLFSYIGVGATSKQPIEVTAYPGEPGCGIQFVVPNAKAVNGQEADWVTIPARAEFVVNTLRNVVLGAKGARLCLVEHILAACALWGVDDLLIIVDGLEIPLDDGSANIWIELFKRSGLPKKTPACKIDLKQPLFVGQREKRIIALPSESFSITYMMDWPHPLIGKRWQTWQGGADVTEIAVARTFARQLEQEMLGLTDGGVSLTESGFSKPLKFEDEPVRHKLLDLLGDLTLCGVNPQTVKAQFISIKAGHELDVKMSLQLQKVLNL